MAVYTYQKVLVWDTNPGGVVRLLRNGTVTIKDWFTGDVIDSVTADAMGMVTVTTGFGVITYTTPSGFVSEPIVAPELLATAASFAISEDAAVAALLADSGSSTRAGADALYAHRANVSVNVKDHGATGDGVTDDTAAIQSAINAAATFGAGVYFPRGTFKLSKASGLDYMLEAKAGQLWHGEGAIKVASTAGDYRSVVAGVAVGTDLTGFTVEGLTFDMNNTGNPATTVGSNGTLFAGNPRYAIYAPVGDRVTVRTCIFKDIDSVNTVVIGGTNARVQDNTFTEVGQSNNVHDHSTLYITAAGQTITGNVFLGVAGGKGATTAIETHGSAQVVTGNRVRDFYCGANITGITASGSDGAVVANNVFRDVNNGVVLWSATAGTGLRQCSVHDNAIILNHDNWLRTTTDYARGIAIDPAINVDVETLSIHHNHIWVKPSVATAQAGELQAAAIALWAASATPVLKNVLVERNTIVGSMSAGIRWAATGNRVRIENNEIVDPGSSTEAALASFYKSGITIVGTVTDMRVKGNRTFDTRGAHVVAQGIMTSLTTATRCLQGDNPVVCADGAVLVPFVQTAGKLFAVAPESPVATRFTTSLYYSPQGGRGTVATVNGTGTAAPFWVSQPTTFDRIGAQVTVVGAAGTVVRLGIYADNGNGTPGALIIDAGTIAGDAVASAEVAISKTLAPGLYWLVAVSQGGAPTMTCMSGSNEVGAGSTLAVATGTAPRSGFTFVAAGALPATFASAGQTSAAVIVALRAA